MIQLYIHIYIFFFIFFSIMVHLSGTFLLFSSSSLFTNDKAEDLKDLVTDLNATVFLLSNCKIRSVFIKY